VIYGIYKRTRPLCPSCGAPTFEIFSGQWQCISAACHQPISSICRCGAKKILLTSKGSFFWSCVYCDIFFETIGFGYRNHCYSCQSDIDSAYCLKSVVSIAGYHCINCGRDLHGRIVLLRRAA